MRFEYFGFGFDGFCEFVGFCVLYNFDDLVVLVFLVVVSLENIGGFDDFGAKDTSNCLEN